jgi:predicted phosphoribosyltransferase
MLTLPALFPDRAEAGNALAQKLSRYGGRPDVVVLGLPRGGVPVAAEVARSLGAPLDVWLVRKLGVPHEEEFAMGAIASGGIIDLDHALIRQLRIPARAVRHVLERELHELERRETAYRGHRAALDLRDRIVIVVDDGLATGSTMRAAVSAVRHHRPAFVVAAAPVASKEACADLALHADHCVCVVCLDPFRAVGTWYEDFSATTDEEVIACLGESRDGGRPSAHAGAAPRETSAHDQGVRS